MIISVTDLKSVIAKLNLAIEKNKINPKAGWLEMEAYEKGLIVKVSNFDYFVKAVIHCDVDNSDSLHVTVSSETFVPLVSKLEGGSVKLEETRDFLLLTTDSGEYTIPLIKEGGKAKTLQTIRLDGVSFATTVFSGRDISGVSQRNVKGAVDSLFSNDSEIQSHVYLDNFGAITFTENVYVNNFKSVGDTQFKVLLSFTQAKLLSIFSDCDLVNFQLELQEAYTGTTKARFFTGDLQLALIVPSAESTDRYPSIRLRRLAESVKNTHVVVDKKALDKALARLMVFDKKFDITVFNYSKIVFGESSLRLVSIKNNNYEIIPYLSQENAFDHETMIRFADLVNQLKAIDSKTIDISYGDSPAIAINADGMIQLIPEIVARG